ncbi:MAG: hypothetical protein HZA01_00020 [Nitrospinae bacterium]|nr:hypothetical protein [Nitrospinota bacterium]
MKDKTIEPSREFLLSCPKTGNLIVPGYVSTKYFSIFLKDVSSQANLIYGVNQDRFAITAKAWLVYLSGEIKEVAP